jgi:hypothetical protein
MDNVCALIAATCSTSEQSEKVDVMEYIDFSDCEEQDWTIDEHVDYVQSKLKTCLGDDVSDVNYSVDSYKQATISFLYKGYKGEIWDTYNSRNYRFWVVSI